jgi:hypothetical protein
MHFSIGNADKGGDVAVQVQQRVHFDGGFVFAKSGPGKRLNLQSLTITIPVLLPTRVPGSTAMNTSLGLASNVLADTSVCSVANRTAGPYIQQFSKLRPSMTLLASAT